MALKHRLLTLPNPSIVTLPRLSIEGSGFTNNVLSFTNANTQRTISVKQTIDSNIAIPDGTSDVTFSIFVPDRFLSLIGSQYLQLEPTTRIATYNKVRTSSTDGAATVELTFGVRNITDTTYNIYGDGTTIKSVVSVVGDQSGLRKEFQVEITT